MALKPFGLKVLGIAILLSTSLDAQWITGHYESQNGVEPVSSIPWSKYTHVVHFAAAPDGSGGVSMHWLSQSEITQIIAARPAGKKVIVCIQDNGSNWNAFAQSTAPGMIGTFVNNIVNFVNSNGYDGVDIDWEVNINATQYAQLFSQLRAALPGKVITSDMNNDTAAIQAAAASYGSVDQFNIMCYDMDTPGNGYSWYNDGLFQAGNGSVMTCDWRVNPFLNAGVPAAKIGIGLPFYGRRWYGVTKALVNGSFSTATVLYKDLVTDGTRWQAQYQLYDSTYKSNYLSIPSLNEFDSYTGVQEIQDAAAWIKSRGFGGAMAFSLYYEFLAGQAGDAQYPLSSALYNALGGSAPPPSSGPVVSNGSPAGTLASATTQVTMSVSTNVNATCKYATSPGMAYSSMPYVFSTTGGTVHSVVLISLTAGSSYNYYVRCADSSGAADTSDYLVSFSIAQAVASSTPQNSVTPSSGSGASQTFAFHVTDGAGYTAVTELDTFIGVQIGGTNNCRIQFAPPNILYLQADDGVSWSQTIAGTSATLQNSQCILNAGASSVSGSGNTLNLNLALSFQSGYAGAKTIYAFAADAAGLISGWQAVGSWNVTTSSAAPALGSSVSPNSGSGSSAVFQLKVSDSNGYGSVLHGDLIIGTQVIGSNTCYVVYFTPYNVLLLRNDSDTAWAIATVGSAATISNGQCSVNAAGASVSGSGNTLTVNIPVSFGSGFKGTKQMYTLAADQGGTLTAWQPAGSWTVR